MKNVAPIKKAEHKLQIAFGEVYAPNFPDAHGDYMTAEEIRKMAHRFLSSGRVNMIDHQHDNNLVGASVVESFIARDGDPIYIPGSWVIGVHVPDTKIWAMIENQEINGFSFEGMARTDSQIIELSIPSEVQGRTADHDGHSHDFVVFYDLEGQFLGGVTRSAIDSEGREHVHVISKGTLTDEAEHGSHRFSYVELIVSDEGEEDES